MITEEEKIMNTNDQTRETILTEPEAAEYLKLSAMTLQRNRNSRKLGFYQIGGRVTYSMEKHIQPFLESCHQPARIVE